ncbi:MAG: glutamate--tRNA ligase [Candidatus Schekmanbacteria bacterium]|nr:glutamate--tRNA ligase [Candidatus Schekmanbacteria bacterium]
MQNKNIRVRFAPSPTGYLHIGNARTALFNWLCARKYRGQFILRIEDTDRERSRPEYEQAIFEDLHWLGLNWDEGPQIGGEFGPYRQSERNQLYVEAAEKLVQSGHAYYCYCTNEELERQRKDLLAQGKPPRYVGTCSQLSEKERLAYEQEGRKPSIRFRPADTGIMQVNDLVHGIINIEQELLGDFIILRSNKTAAYNLAVVIDDALMQVTHVIRGEDHLSNTPRQQMLYEALGYCLPAFVHMPMILGSDRTMLSKRHGATSVRQFRQQGFLAKALVNYLALLGWSPGEERELLSMEELIEAFNLSHLAKGAAVFDLPKLSWINAHYIREEDINILTELCLPYLKSAGYIKETPHGESWCWLHNVIEAVQPNLTQVDQVVQYARPFFCDDFILDPEAAPAAKDGLKVIQELYIKITEGPERYSEQSFQEIIKSLQQATGMKGKKLYMPIRIALSGSLKGPELQHLLLLLNREHCLRRVQNSLRQLEG